MHPALETKPMGLPDSRNGASSSTPTPDPIRHTQVQREGCIIERQESGYSHKPQEKPSPHLPTVPTSHLRSQSSADLTYVPLPTLEIGWHPTPGPLGHPGTTSLPGMPRYANYTAPLPCRCACPDTREPASTLETLLHTHIHTHTETYRHAARGLSHSDTWPFKSETFQNAAVNHACTSTGDTEVHGL